jgi:hypothetical protein
VPRSAAQNSVVATLTTLPSLKTAKHVRVRDLIRRNKAELLLFFCINNAENDKTAQAIAKLTNMTWNCAYSAEFL